MFQHSKLNRLIVAGITAAAIAPTAGGRVPGDRRRRGRRPASTQDFRAPDQADGSTVDRSVPA